MKTAYALAGTVVFVGVSGAVSVPCAMATAAGQRWGANGRFFTTALNSSTRLPVFRGVEASFYTPQSNSGGPTATSTTVPFRPELPMIAVSFDALLRLGNYRIAYGDILRIRNPANGRVILAVVADVGSLRTDKNPNRVLDLNENLFKYLSGCKNAYQCGVVRNLEVEVVDRIMSPPTASNKFPGLDGKGPAAIQARIEAVHRGEYNHLLNGQTNPAVLATEPLQRAAQWGSALVTQPLQRVAEGVGGLVASQLTVKSERDGWEQLLSVASESSSDVHTGFEKLTEVQSRYSGTVLEALRQGSSYNRSIAASLYDYQVSYYTSLQQENQRFRYIDNQLKLSSKADALKSIRIASY